jgi:oligopeptide transport system substrate-binding protein
MNVTRPPFNDIRVRKAFALAVDRQALSDFRKTTQPLFDIVPAGVYPEYDRARAKVSEEIRVSKGISPEAWARYNKFDAEGARKLLTEAGFPVQKSGNTYSCPNFPTDTVSLIFNTNENNKAVAEFVQAQWRQNLGVTIPLQSQEFKTFLKDRHDVQYTGFAQSLWSGDYMDPYTFLGLHYGYPNNGDTGFNDPKYNKMLDDANAQLDPLKRYEMLARAEFYLMEQMPSVPLTIAATNWMKKPYVKGMYPNPGTLLPWKFVYIERDPARWDRDVQNIMAQSDPAADKQLADLVATQKAQAPQ